MEKINSKKENASLVILGAIFGDIIGSAYEFHRTKNYDFKLYTKHSNFTDDTVCTIAIAYALVNHKSFSETLRKWCRKYFWAGYGGNFRQWIYQEPALPYGSWGNGSAMRVSPVGVWSKTLEESDALAKASAEVTHNHPEGIKGAQSVANAIFMSLQGNSKEHIKDFIERTYGYDLSRKYEEIKQDYRFEVSCMRSVPESIICFLESHDYESAVRLAVSMGGDADTMACIAGGIAAAFYGSIPDVIMEECMRRLPEEMKEIIEKFNSAL